MYQRNKQEFYQVKELLDLITEDEKQYCLVWWKNFPKSEATWEPIQNMTFMDKWDKYYKQLKDKISRKELQEEEGSQSSQDVEKSLDQFKKSKSRGIKKEKNLGKAFKKLGTRIKGKDRIKMKIQKFKRLRSERKQLKESKAEEIYEQSEEKEQSDISQQSSSSSSDQEQIKLPAPKKVEVRIPKVLNKPFICKSRMNQQAKNKIQQSDDIKIVQFKGKRVQLRPMTIDLQIVESKIKPFQGQEIQRIRGSVMRSGEMLYDVQFKNDPMKESILLHNKYLKLLWPRKLAEYLIQKMKNDNLSA